MAQKAAGEADYDFNLSGLKDAYRGSIACPTDRDYDKVISTLDRLIIPANGMTLERTSGGKKDKFKDLSANMGYGDMTYFVIFREEKVACELQVHKIGMLFGKMSAVSWHRQDLDQTATTKEETTKEDTHFKKVAKQLLCSNL